MNVASDVILNVRCVKYKCHHITSHDWQMVFRTTAVLTVLVFRSTTIMMLNLGSTWGWEVSPKLWPLYPRGKSSLPTLEAAGSVPGPIWTEKEMSPHRNSITGPVAGSYTDCTSLVPLNIWPQNITVMCTVSWTEHYYYCYRCGKLNLMIILSVPLCLIHMMIVLTDMCVPSVSLKV